MKRVQIDVKKHLDSFEKYQNILSNMYFKIALSKKITYNIDIGIWSIHEYRKIKGKTRI